MSPSEIANLRWAVLGSRVNGIESMKKTLGHYFENILNSFFMKCSNSYTLTITCITGSEHKVAVEHFLTKCERELADCSVSGRQLLSSEWL